MKRKVTEKASAFATELARDAEQLFGEHMDAMLTRAHEYAMESLRRDIETGGGQ